MEIKYVSHILSSRKLRLDCTWRLDVIGTRTEHKGNQMIDGKRSFFEERGRNEMPKIEERNKEQIRSFFRSFFVTDILDYFNISCPKLTRESLQKYFWILPPFLIKNTKYNLAIKSRTMIFKKGPEKGTKKERCRNGIAIFWKERGRNEIMK